MIQELFLILQQQQQLLFFLIILLFNLFNLSSLDSIIDINKNIYINRKWLYKHLNKEQLMLDLKKRILINGETKRKIPKLNILYPNLVICIIILSMWWSNFRINKIDLLNEKNKKNLQEEEEEIWGKHSFDWL